MNSDCDSGSQYYSFAEDIISAYCNDDDDQLSMRDSGVSTMKQSQDRPLTPISIQLHQESVQLLRNPSQRSLPARSSSLTDTDCGQSVNKSVCDNYEIDPMSRRSTPSVTSFCTAQTYDLVCTREQYLVGCRKFNLDQQMGLNHLIRCNYFINDSLSPESVAQFLFQASSQQLVTKRAVGAYLCDHREFNQQVLAEFTRLIDFSTSQNDLMDLLSALRRYLEMFKLPGEAQQIDRVITAFAGRYSELVRYFILHESDECSDPSILQSIWQEEDITYLVCFSFILLNTDLHNQQVRHKMKRKVFVRNNLTLMFKQSRYLKDVQCSSPSLNVDGERSQEHCFHIMRHYLEQCYESILQIPFNPLMDEKDDFKVDQQLFLSRAVRSGWLRVKFHRLPGTLTLSLFNRNNFCVLANSCLFIFCGHNRTQYTIVPLLNFQIASNMVNPGGLLSRIIPRRQNKIQISSMDQSPLKLARISKGLKPQDACYSSIELCSDNASDVAKWTSALQREVVYTLTSKKVQ
ncbi:hypothetical protein MP228_004644 [Amoeboaphelidium protococcarum]|nr:hypothetical protein MP228_004644 [Amoeboaphelidium protococcarum]